MKTIGCIVTQGGKPCKIHNNAAKASTKRGGVLTPGSPVEMFTQARDAKRAIKRTQRVVEALRGSLLDDWAAVGPLLNGEGYEIVPLVKQEGDETPAKPATPAPAL